MKKQYKYKLACLNQRIYPSFVLRCPGIDELDYNAHNYVVTQHRLTFENKMSKIAIPKSTKQSFNFSLGFIPLKRLQLLNNKLTSHLMPWIKVAFDHYSS